MTSDQQRCADRSDRATAAPDPDVAAYALRLGDDALVLGPAAVRVGRPLAAARGGRRAAQRRARPARPGAQPADPRAGELEGGGRTEDDLAFLRDEPDFTNALLFETDNGDFGRTMARQLLVSAYQLPLWQALTGSADEVLAGVAGKAVKEAAYHLDHARSWVVRLGDGTEESHRRVQAGLDEVWPYAYELFERDPLVERLVARGIAADPALLRPQWQAHRQGRAGRGDARRCRETTWRPTGGRRAATSPASATCWPSCSTCTAATRARRGDTRPRPPPEQVREVLAAVTDPEIPVITIEDLGILRDVAVDDGRDHRDDHADLLRVPGDGRDRRRRPRPRSAGRAGTTSSVRTVLSPGLDHRLDERGRAAQAARVRHRAAVTPRRRTGARAAGPRPARPPRRRRSRARSAARRDTEELTRFALDLVQGACGAAAAAASRSTTSARTDQPTRTSSPVTSQPRDQPAGSPVTTAALTADSGRRLPPGSRRAGRAVDPLTDDSVAITFDGAGRAGRAVPLHPGPAPDAAPRGRRAGRAPHLLGLQQLRRRAAAGGRQAARGRRLLQLGRPAVSRPATSSRSCRRPVASGRASTRPAAGATG